MSNALKIELDKKSAKITYGFRIELIATFWAVWDSILFDLFSFTRPQRFMPNEPVRLFLDRFYLLCLTVSTWTGWYCKRNACALDAIHKAILSDMQTWARLIELQDLRIHSYVC